MKRIILILLFLISVQFISCRQSEDEPITEDQLTELREFSEEFTNHLKSVLVDRMQKDGVMNAVTICADTARIMTRNFAIQKNIYIKRVSFKNRNPENYPDDFEAEALKYFEQMHSTGKLTPMSEYVEITDLEDGKYLRFMKPIFVQAPCLNCHGSKSSMSGEVVKFLAVKYPDDKGTGFALNDLRGAVSIMKKTD